MEAVTGAGVKHYTDERLRWAIRIDRVPAHAPGKVIMRGIFTDKKAADLVAEYQP